MKDKIKQIRLELKMSQGDFARKINIIQQQLSKYERGENKPSAEFLTKLVKEINVNINWLLTGEGEMFITPKFNPDVVEIEYYENPALTDIIRNPDIKSVWLDKNLIRNIWRKNEKNLKILQMPGDYMRGRLNDFTINNKDIVLIDTSSTNVSLSGIYAYTTQNEQFLFIKAIQRLANGALKFNINNENYQCSTYYPDELKKIDFKVLGRVVKNLSSYLD